MSSRELEKMKELADALEDALQPSELLIAQDARGRWPKFDETWRYRQIIVKQGRDGSWPSYNRKLEQHSARPVIEILSFKHGKVAHSEPPYYRTDGHPAAVADFRQRQHALASGRPIPINGDLADL